MDEALFERSADDRSAHVLDAELCAAASDAARPAAERSIADLRLLLAEARSRQCARVGRVFLLAPVIAALLLVAIVVLV